MPRRFLTVSRRSSTDWRWNYFAAAAAAASAAADAAAGGVNRSAACESRGGTCVRAADCATNSAVELTGTGSRFTSRRDRYLGDSDSGGGGDQIRSFLCNLTAICCLPQPTDDTGAPPRYTGEKMKAAHTRLPSVGFRS